MVVMTTAKKPTSSSPSRKAKTKPPPQPLYHRRIATVIPLILYLPVPANRKRPSREEVTHEAVKVLQDTLRDTPLARRYAIGQSTDAPVGVAYLGDTIPELVKLQEEADAWKWFSYAVTIIAVILLIALIGVTR
jgi:hypothetical protein